MALPPDDSPPSLAEALHRFLAYAGISADVTSDRTPSLDTKTKAKTPVWAAPSDRGKIRAKRKGSGQYMKCLNITQGAG